MWSPETIRIVAQMPQNGLFLLGIDDSDLANYEERLAKIRASEANQSAWLRFGSPYAQAHPAKDQYDLGFMDKIVAECQALDLNLVADLLKSDLPAWLHLNQATTPHWQNAYFPFEFAKYAAHLAARYPSITRYSLITQPLAKAIASAELAEVDDDAVENRAFVRAITNIAKAAILGRRAIEQVWIAQNRAGEPLFIQTESLERATALPGSDREAEARLFNTRRFAGLDLIFGHSDKKIERYLLEQGLPAGEYQWFMEHGKADKTILELRHLPTSLHCLTDDQTDQTIDQAISQPHLLLALIEEYWERYQQPLLYSDYSSEYNEVGFESDAVINVAQPTDDLIGHWRGQGYPIVGMTWPGDQPPAGELAAFDHYEAKYRLKPTATTTN